MCGYKSMYLGKLITAYTAISLYFINSNNVPALSSFPPISSVTFS